MPATYYPGGDGVCTNGAAYATVNTFNTAGRGLLVAAGSISTYDYSNGGEVCIVLDGAICGVGHNWAKTTGGTAITGGCQKVIHPGSHTVVVVVTNPSAIYDMSVNVVPMN